MLGVQAVSAGPSRFLATVTRMLEMTGHERIVCSLHPTGKPDQCAAVPLDYPRPDAVPLSRTTAWFGTAMSSSVASHARGSGAMPPRRRTRFSSMTSARSALRRFLDYCSTPPHGGAFERTRRHAGVTTAYRVVIPKDEASDADRLIGGHKLRDPSRVGIEGAHRKQVLARRARVLDAECCRGAAAARNAAPRRISRRSSPSRAHRRALHD